VQRLLAALQADLERELEWPRERLDLVSEELVVVERMSEGGAVDGDKKIADEEHTEVVGFGDLVDDDQPALRVCADPEPERLLLEHDLVAPT